MKILINKVKYKKGNEETYYGIYPVSIIDNKNITHFAFRLYCKLLNSKNGYVTSINALAKQLNVSSNLIDTSVKILKDNGYIESVGDRTTTVWKIYQIQRLH